MNRTEDNFEILDTLHGIREVGEDYADRIDEIHGMYDKFGASLERVPGKLLATTGVGAGPVWDLHQLRFRDGFRLMVHEGANLVVGRMSLPHTGQRYNLPIYPDPILGSDNPTDGPYIDWYDWPEDWEEREGFEGVPGLSEEEWEVPEEFSYLPDQPNFPIQHYSSYYLYIAYTLPSAMTFALYYGQTGTWKNSYKLILEGHFAHVFSIEEDAPTGLLGGYLGIDYQGMWHRSNYIDPRFEGLASYFQYSYDVELTITKEQPLPVGSHTSIVVHDLVRNVAWPYYYFYGPDQAVETIQCVVLAPLGIKVDPGTLRFQSESTSTIVRTESFTVLNENADEVSLDWTAVITCPLNPAEAGRLTLSSNSGTLVAGGSEFIIATHDPVGLAAGTYRYLITVTDQFGSEAVVIADAVNYDYNDFPPRIRMYFYTLNPACNPPAGVIHNRRCAKGAGPLGYWFFSASSQCAWYSELGVANYKFGSLGDPCYVRGTINPAPTPDYVFDPIAGTFIIPLSGPHTGDPTSEGPVNVYADMCGLEHPFEAPGCPITPPS